MRGGGGGGGGAGGVRVDAVGGGRFETEHVFECQVSSVGFQVVSRASRNRHDFWKLASIPVAERTSGRLAPSGTTRKISRLS